MGNRANIFVKNDYNSQTDESIGVYLYTHWDGAELPYILQDALKRRQRWNDESYLTRIIFSEMIKRDVEGETGYGISTYECDSNNPLISIDCDKETVTIKNVVWKFEEYITLTAEEIDAIYNARY